jgi:hypothetical protein
MNVMYFTQVIAVLMSELLARPMPTAVLDIKASSILMRMTDRNSFAAFKSAEMEDSALFKFHNDSQNLLLS